MLLLVGLWQAACFLGVWPLLGLLALALVLLDCDIVTLVLSLVTKPRFDGKVVWVTGASSGIGEEMAYQLSRLGATLVLSARRESELKRVCQGCDNPKRHVVVPLDLSDTQSHKSKVEQVLRAVGHVDILVNNAGVAQRSLVDTCTLAADKQLLDTNLVGTISLTKQLLPHFLKRAAGACKPHVAVVSSVAGKCGTPGLATYSASKHALHGYFTSLQQEVPVGVTMICPGPVVSKVAENALDDNGRPTGEEDDFPLKMSTARCAKLSLVALHNRVAEAWMAPGVVLVLLYLAQYSPLMMNLLGKAIGGFVAKEVRKKVQKAKGQ